MQIGRLYSFYLKKIFKKNYWRILFISLYLVGVVWFLIPYLFFSYSSGLTVEHEGNDGRIHTTTMDKFENFSEFNKEYFGSGKKPVVKYYVKNRELLAEKIKELEEKKAAGAPRNELEAIGHEIHIRKNASEKLLFGFRVLPHTDSNVFLFNQTTGYTDQGMSFWKLLNDISWWNLSGVIILFWLTFNVLDSIFLTPKKDGEEIAVVTLTPSVQRSDLFVSKILAWLTFYSFINVLLFLLPYGIYYWWVAGAASFGIFAWLALYTTIVGPLLFTGLILLPYIYLTSLNKLLGVLFYSVISFIPIIYLITKTIFVTHTWPYWVEEKFFHPAIFTIISLVVGIIFLFLYYQRYQKEDLNN